MSYWICGASYLFFLLLWLLSSSFIKIEVVTLLYVFSLYITLIVAGLMFDFTRQLTTTKSFRENRVKEYERSIYLAGRLGLLSFCLRVFDKFFYRGAEFSSNFSNILNHLQDQGSSIIGIVTAPVIFFCMFPYFYERKINKNSRIWFVIFWLPAIDSMLTGQRFVLLYSLFSYLFIFLFFSGKKNINSYFSILMIAVLAISAAFLLILNRYNGYGFTVWYSLQHSQYAELLDIPGFLSSDSPIAILLFYNLLFYFQHSIYELQYALNDGLFHFTYGGFNFPVVYVLLEKLGLETIDVWSGFDRRGIYLTFYGTSWYDFGPLVYMYTFVLGVVLRAANIKSLSSGRVGSTVTFVFASYVVIMMPVTTMVGYGNGNYLLVTLVLWKALKLKWF